jgi:hypothetical protein
MLVKLALAPRAEEVVGLVVEEGAEDIEYSCVSEANFSAVLSGLSMA